MAITLKVLGQASIGKEDEEHVYELLTEYSSNEITEGKAALVKNIRIASRGSGNRTVTIYYVPGGEDEDKRAISPPGLTLTPNTLVILDDELVLVATDKLQAIFGEDGDDTTDYVDVVLSGIERDA